MVNNGFFKADVPILIDLDLPFHVVEIIQITSSLTMCGDQADNTRVCI